jgi:hypothetical protein
LDAGLVSIGISAENLPQCAAQPPLKTVKKLLVGRLWKMGPLAGLWLQMRDTLPINLFWLVF